MSKTRTLLDPFEARLVARAERLKNSPALLRAFIGGLQVDGTLDSKSLKKALLPYMPPAPVETDDSLINRMAAEITRAVSLTESVTTRDLERAGFAADEIELHFTAARKVARVDRMVA